MKVLLSVVALITLTACSGIKFDTAKARHLYSYTPPKMNYIRPEAGYPEEPMENLTEQDRRDIEDVVNNTELYGW